MNRSSSTIGREFRRNHIKGVCSAHEAQLLLLEKFKEKFNNCNNEKTPQTERRRA